ncbi:carbohydrate-binding X8 domain superfamily protein [Actinidia rufa]|uniref:Carbohydrate-binding X8 domain superfamily protein n=1 Tax=Actinidia rufa TaxID=165716 RepID=A0A7J0E7I0_9ERIC|nr:carbohydrate-binding X8 domain superfamily protein [Actinidia rufa]
MASVLAMAVLLVVALLDHRVVAVETTWCVVKSDASDDALLTALNYACGSGADCGPIQSSGLCYLPNTVQSHTSYAFNSYYQRKDRAPGTCDFAGTATIAKTDPSVMDPVRIRRLQAQRGGNGGTPTTPSSRVPPLPGTTGPINGNGGLTPTYTNNSKASVEFSITKLLISLSCCLACYLITVSIHVEYQLIFGLIFCSYGPKPPHSEQAGIEGHNDCFNRTHLTHPPKPRHKKNMIAKLRAAGFEKLF